MQLFFNDFTSLALFYFSHYVHSARHGRAQRWLVRHGYYLLGMDGVGRDSVDMDGFGVDRVGTCGVGVDGIGVVCTARVVAVGMSVHDVKLIMAR